MLNYVLTMKDFKLDVNLSESRDCTLLHTKSRFLFEHTARPHTKAAAAATLAARRREASKANHSHARSPHILRNAVSDAVRRRKSTWRRLFVRAGVFFYVCTLRRTPHTDLKLHFEHDHFINPLKVQNSSLPWFARTRFVYNSSCMMVAGWRRRRNEGGGGGRTARTGKTIVVPKRSPLRSLAACITQTNPTPLPLFWNLKAPLAPRVSHH